MNQTKTEITIENNNSSLFVKESVDEILNEIKNTMGDNFITLTIYDIDEKLYVRAKSIISIRVKNK